MMMMIIKTMMIPILVTLVGIAMNVSFEHPFRALLPGT